MEIKELILVILVVPLFMLSVLFITFKYYLFGGIDSNKKEEK